jgi:hypothetical protein
MGRSRRWVIPLALAVGVAVAVAYVGAVGAAPGRPFQLDLSGAEEVPENPHGDDDRGSVRLTINLGQRTVCWRFGELMLVETQDLPFAGHIHEGPRGVAGDVVLTLFGAPSNELQPPDGLGVADNTPPAPTSYPTGTVCVEGVQRSLLRDIFRSPQNYYVNLHNDEHPAGVVREQLR